MIYGYVQSGRPNNRRVGRCARCSRLREVFDIDGTTRALCVTCLRDQVAVASEFLASDQLYEGSTALDWWHAHNSGHDTGVVGCPWCGAGIVS